MKKLKDVKPGDKVWAYLPKQLRTYTFMGIAMVEVSIIAIHDGELIIRGLDRYSISTGYKVGDDILTYACRVFATKAQCIKYLRTECMREVLRRRGIPRAEDRNASEHTLKSIIETFQLSSFVSYEMGQYQTTPTKWCLGPTEFNTSWPGGI